MTRREKDMNCAGTWDLVKASTYRAQLTSALPGPGEPWAHGVIHWLQGRGSEFPGELFDATGVTLVIDDDHRFTQEATSAPPVMWVDTAGVVVPTVPCFAGAVTRDSTGAWLVADDTPPHARGSGWQYGVTLRYDDGDSRVCDRLERSRNTLTRTINLVTDDFHFQRTVLSYVKRKGR